MGAAQKSNLKIYMSNNDGKPKMERNIKHDVAHLQIYSTA